MKKRPAPSAQRRRRAKTEPMREEKNGSGQFQPAYMNNKTTKYLVDRKERKTRLGKGKEGENEEPEDQTRREIGEKERGGKNRVKGENSMSDACARVAGAPIF